MLVRQRAIYHFRRRVPQRLLPVMNKREVWYSLRTSDRPTAKARAAALWVWTERVFNSWGENGVKLREEIEVLLRQAQEVIDRGDDAADLLARLDRAIEIEELQCQVLKAKEEAAQEKLSALRFANDVATKEMEFGEKLHQSISRTQTLVNNIKGGLIEARDARKSMEKIVIAVTEADKARTAEPPVKDSPLFSANIGAFLKDKTKPDDGGRAYSNQTVEQVRATFRLLVEFLGDKPVRTYTKAEARELRSRLLELPFSHGKSRSNPMTGPEAIAHNMALEVPKKTITMKTAKRHFSALSQYWEWLEATGHVDLNIFRGFSFPGTKSGKRRKRDEWSDDDLKTVFTFDKWYGPDASRDSAYFWLPLVALYSGMRVEEIARLRPSDDIQTINGIAAFVIQPHPDGWNPKTEAGERVIPVHSALIRLGFLDFVERRRQAKAGQLFADLKPGGPDGKYSYTFSREFSRAKIKLGVGSKTTFHSFRHTVRTLLTNTDASLRDPWIDAVMGHDPEDGESRRISEGIKTYLKYVRIEWMKEVVEAIQPTVDVVEMLG